MRFRKLRIAWTVVCGFACLLLIALWVRSYWVHDYAVLMIAADSSFSAESSHGRLLLMSLGPLGAIPGSFEFGSRDAGWPSFRDVLNGNVLGFDFSRQAVGSLLAIPHWFAVLLSATLASLPWIRWRFSLSTLLIAMTLVAVVLGLIVYLSSTEPTPPLDHGDFNTERN